MKEQDNYLNYVNEIEKRISDKKTELAETIKAISDIKSDNKAAIKGKILGISVKKTVDFSSIPKLEEKKIVLNYEIEALEEMRFGRETIELAKELINAAKEENKRILLRAEEVKKESEELLKKHRETRDKAESMNYEAGGVLSNAAFTLYQLAENYLGHEMANKMLGYNGIALLNKILEL